jgi:hypothetical protein
MTWDATVGFCVCTDNTRVIFIVSSALSCRSCGADTFSNPGRRSTPFSCRCPTGSVWQHNVGCVCTGQNAIPVIRGTSPRCLTCDILVYSSGAALTKEAAHAWGPSRGIQAPQAAHATVLQPSLSTTVCICVSHAIPAYSPQQFGTSLNADASPRDW